MQRTGRDLFAAKVGLFYQKWGMVLENDCDAAISVTAVPALNSRSLATNLANFYLNRIHIG